MLFRSRTAPVSQWIPNMSRNTKLFAFADQVGFEVSIDGDVVRAARVPCLLKDGEQGTCTIEKSFDPSNGPPTDRLGSATHAVRVRTDPEIDGLVYGANGSPIGNCIDTDQKSWSDISIKKVPLNAPVKDESAEEVVHRYAKQIVGAVTAAGESTWDDDAVPSPFKIPNTFETRAALAPIQDRARRQSVAIIGLGGTGSYVLDLISKAPVSEIHLIDDDVIKWHNLFRAPGAPTAEEVESLRAGEQRKVDYHSTKQESFREGMQPHSVQVNGTEMWRDFLAAHPVDFAFVCIDQAANEDSSRQDGVYQALAETGVPFIDSGVSISVEGGAIRGVVRTSFNGRGSDHWKPAIPNAKVAGAVQGYRNVQLPEVNALAASLAVMEWRRRTEQYCSESSSIRHDFRLETSKVVAVPGHEDGESV